MTETIQNNAIQNNANQELVISRIFDAPREVLWKAWTEPEQIKHWWGPKGFTSPIFDMDLRVGGAYINCMRASDGKKIWGTGVYREIIEPELLVFTDSFSDAEGNLVPAAYYGMSGDWPLELLVRVTFEQLDGLTKLTLHHIGIPAGENRDLAEAGWSESFDKLEDYLGKDEPL